MVPCPRTPFSRSPLLSRTIPKKDPISQEGADRRSLGYWYQLITLFCLERGGGQLAQLRLRSNQRKGSKDILCEPNHCWCLLFNLWTGLNKRPVHKRAGVPWTLLVDEIIARTVFLKMFQQNSINWLKYSVP